MASAVAETKETFPCTKAELFKIIADYEKYPEFLAEVKSVKILKKSTNTKEMEYSISLIKTFKYILKATEIPDQQVDFTFVSGDVFKSMHGCWKLSEKNGVCSVDYKVEATFGMLVPQAMAKTLVSVNLPIMMANFKKRVKAIYGK